MLGRHVTPDRRSEMAAPRKAKLCLGGICSSFCYVLALVALCAFVGLTVFRQDYLDGMVQQQIDHMVPLLEGSQSTAKWVHPPAPVYIKYYFFNLKNPTEFEEKGAKPEFEEFGPFVYRENKTKFGLEWMNNETEVGYHLDATYHYEPSMSYSNPMTFKITSINTVLVGVIQYIERQLSGLEKDVVNEVLNLLTRLIKEYFVVTHTVHEWIWGYEDKMLKDLDEAIDLMNVLLKPFKKHIAKPPDMVAFQVNASTNDSLGWSIVYTGKGNLSNIAMYKQWNNLTHISGWLGDGGVIRGGEGVLFSPQISRDQQLYAYISQLYRSGYFTYDRDEAIFGIPVYRFVIPKEELLNSSLNPANAKYWMDGPSGVLNLTTVFPLNAPVFASKPHFLDADPAFLNNVTGLSPNREKHDSYLDVEPMTGAVFSAAKRIQLNFHLKADSHIRAVKTIMDGVMFPVFYACEEGGLTEALASDFKKQVYLVDNLVVGGEVLAGICFLLFCLFGTCCICCCCCLGNKNHCGRRKRMQNPINDERQKLLM